MINNNIVNKDRLYDVYINLFLNSDYNEYMYSDDSSERYIKYQTKWFEINGICYKFTVSREWFIFKFFYNAWVEIALNENLSLSDKMIKPSNNVYVYFKSKDIKNFTSMLINKITNKHIEEITDKYIPIEYLRREKLLNIKENIK